MASLSFNSFAISSLTRALNKGIDAVPPVKKILLKSSRRISTSHASIASVIPVTNETESTLFNFG